MSDKYALIIEHKAEGPLVMEQLLSSADYDSVYTRMQGAIKDPRIVRACIVKLEFESGNKAVLS